MSVFNLLFHRKSILVTFLRNYCYNRRPVYIKRKRICLYETLELNKNCSPLEIRNAYIKLSKQYHPDLNKDKQSHQKFLEISEAYNVLSKPLSKRDYDAGLTRHFYEETRPRPRSTPFYTESTYNTQGGWTDYSFWEHRDRTNDHPRSQAYYGIKGINKISNGWIALLCLGFAAIGVFLQFLAIQKSFTLKRSEMEKRSASLEILHAEVRERALRNGDDEQLKLIVEHINRNKRN